MTFKSANVLCDQTTINIKQLQMNTEIHVTTNLSAVPEATESKTSDNRRVFESTVTISRAKQPLSVFMSLLC